MPKFDFSYDKENDDLFLFNPKSKSKGSIEAGGIILDCDNKKNIVGIQIMNASKLINEMIKDKNSKEIKKILSNLKKCLVETKIQNKLLIIKIYLFDEKAELNPIISTPFINEPSPALAYT